MSHNDGFCSHGQRFTRWCRTIPAAAFLALLCAGCGLHLPGAPTGPVAYWGFRAPWDSRSDSTLRAHGALLDAAITGWIGFDSTSFRPVLLYPDTATISSPKRFALVTTYQGDRFHPEILRAIAAQPRELAGSAAAIGTLVAEGRYAGVVLDLEGMTVRDLDALLASVKIISDSSRAHGAGTIVVAVPAADTAAYPAALLIQSADYIMPTLYDEHWSGSAPGPVSETAWAIRYLGARAAEVGASRIIAALPTYGYRWRRNASAEVVSFADAERLGELTNTPLVRDPGSRNLHAVSAQGWEIWLADDELLGSLVAAARRIGVRNFALWRLGLEDPRVWPRIGGR